MSDYTKLTDFASKDALPSGNANKIVKGTEIDDEFEAIETAVATKANIASPTFTGTPAAPTAATGVDTTQIATTAFVQQEITANAFNIADGSITTAKLATDAVTGAKIADDAVDSEHLAGNAVDAAALNVSGNGTSGQVLISDGDGSFSWTAQSNIDSHFGNGGSSSVSSGGMSTSNRTYTTTSAGLYVITVNLESRNTVDNSNGASAQAVFGGDRLDVGRGNFNNLLQISKTGQHALQTNTIESLYYLPSGVTITFSRTNANGIAVAQYSYSVVKVQ